MKISKIIQVLDAQCLACSKNIDTEVHSACGSDMMSDVLAFVKDQAVLLTGLINAQVVRTCQMMDIHCIVFVRGKKPSEDVLKLAEGSEIVVLVTDLRMYESCGRLYASGLIGGRTNE